MQFQEAFQYLLGFTDYERDSRDAYSPANFDLRRVEVLLARLGNPHLSTRTVHIAGTKGKGSTAAMIQLILQSAGFRVGLFTSPHLLSFRERIQINRQLIPEEQMAVIVERMIPAVDAVLAEEPTLGRLTTFELITALAFVYFAGEKVDFQVMEAGLGGRLDATNVVSPLVAVITSISLDHTAILGDTIPQIAAEKSGIIKSGATVVVAPQVEAASAVISATCRDRDARLVSVGQDVTWRSGVKGPDGQSLTILGLLDRYEAWIPLIGAHQQENAATAVAAVEALRMAGVDVPSAAVVDGLRRTSWPGRLQVVETADGRPLVVIDGAHNGDSARRVRLAMREHFAFDRAVLILGMSADKDIAGIVHELAPLASKAIITRANHPRSADTSAIAPILQANGIEAVVAPTVAAALDEAKRAAGPDDLVLATGSLFIAAEVLRAYGIEI